MTETEKTPESAPEVQTSAASADSSPAESTSSTEAPVEASGTEPLSDPPVTEFDPSKWPRFQSHKVVRAAKILAIGKSDSQGYVLAEVLGGPAVLLPDEFIGKHSPTVGGYLVVYADGYMSWSPAEAFEGGYTRFEDIALEPGPVVEVPIGDGRGVEYFRQLSEHQAEHIRELATICRRAGHAVPAMPDFESKYQNSLRAEGQPAASA